jgi:monoamine oxidase
LEGGVATASVVETGPRRLWFCGEYIAPFDDCGTVAGAYRSGERAARGVLAALGM